MRTALPFVGLVSLLAACRVASAAPELIDIGGPAGYSFSEALSVSDGGAMVVGDRTIPGPDGIAAFRWTSATGAVAFEPTSTGRTWRTAYVVNPAGNAVVGVSQVNYNALRWRLGVSTPMRSVIGQTASLATDLSDDASIVIGDGQFSGGGGAIPTLVMRWFPDQLFGTGVEVVGTPSWATTAWTAGCSADGRTIVGSSTNAALDDLVPYVWRESLGFAALPFPAGYARAGVSAMSRDGRFAIGSAQGAVPGDVVDCLWNLSTSSVTTLPTLTGTLPGAWGISRDGSVVVGRDWVWTDASGVIALAPFLQAQGINLAGWSQLELRAISADATALCGIGYRNGQYRAWVARGLTALCFPSIRKQPDPAFGIVGGVVTFSIDAGSPAGATYAWYHLGEPGAIANGLRPTGSVASGATSPSLRLSNVSAADAGEYGCVVTTPCGTVFSTFATLAVNEDCGAITRDFAVGASCDNTSQTCDVFDLVTIDTAGPLSVEYIAAPTHCSNVGMYFYLDGVLVAARPPAGPGGSSGIVDFGWVTPGPHVIGLQAFGQVGGCNAGTLQAWGGTLRANFLTVTPTFTQQPQPANVCLYGTQQYIVSATAGGPPLRSWSIGEAIGGSWRPIVNGTNFAASTNRPAFVASGANTETLTIVPYPGFFDDWPTGFNYLQCRIQNACGSTFSEQASILVKNCCTADFNQDGFLTFEDFDAFVAAFEAGDANSDFDGDGFLTFEDFDAYVAAFEAGC